MTLNSCAFSVAALGQSKSCQCCQDVWFSYPLNVTPSFGPCASRSAALNGCVNEASATAGICFLCVAGTEYRMTQTPHVKPVKAECKIARKKCAQHVQLQQVHLGDPKRCQWGPYSLIDAWLVDRPRLLTESYQSNSFVLKTTYSESLRLFNLDRKSHGQNCHWQLVSLLSYSACLHSGQATDEEVQKSELNHPVGFAALPMSAMWQIMKRLDPSGRKKILSLVDIYGCALQILGIRNKLYTEAHFLFSSQCTVVRMISSFAIHSENLHCLLLWASTWSPFCTHSRSKCSSSWATPCRKIIPCAKCLLE